MLVGEDFPKIEFDFLGLDLLEPNTFIGDTLIFVFALYFIYKLRPFVKQHVFFLYWRNFFLLFGVGFFLGGLGHLLYNYWGIPGKTPSWFLGIIAVFYIEQAMISIHPKEKIKKLLSRLSRIKLLLAVVAALLVSIYVDLEADYSKGMLVPTINSTLGLFSTLGFLGFYYSRENKGFNYFWISVLILIPAAVFQALKISFVQWFDKNDVGHILLIVGMFFYYAGIKAYVKGRER